MKRSPLGPGAAALERGSTFKPRSPLARKRRAKRNRARAVNEVAARSAWAETARALPCAMCSGDGPSQGHHIVTQQELRKAVADKPDLVLSVIRWDQRNLLPVCEGCHADHHSRRRPIPMRVLREHEPSARKFAEEIGRSWWLTRTYPETR